MPHKYQIKWISEKFVRDSLKDFPQHRDYLLRKTVWDPFIDAISLKSQIVMPKELDQWVKDRVIEYVRIHKEAWKRNPKKPDPAA